jgi:hypothetical protein
VSALQPFSPQSPEAGILLLPQQGKKGLVERLTVFLIRHQLLVCVTLTSSTTLFAMQLSGIYQTAQNISSLHLCEKCDVVPSEIRQELIFLKHQKITNKGGRKYWINTASEELGVYEIEGGGLRFLPT